MNAIKKAPQKAKPKAETPRLVYNSFAEPNRRNEAQDSLREFAETNLPLSFVKKYICSDDLAAIVEMLVEEMRENNRRIGYNNSLITNAEIVE